MGDNVKYKVTIPPPKAKRMLSLDKKVMVEFTGGFDGYRREKVYFLKPYKFSLEFEIPNDVEYIYNSSIMDGDHFNVFVEYSNENGSRKERIRLVPGKI